MRAVGSLCLIGLIFCIAPQRIAEIVGALSLLFFFNFVNHARAYHEMYVRITRAVRHCADLVMDGICVIVIRKILVDETLNDLEILLERQLILQRKLEFFVSIYIFWRVTVGSTEEHCRGIFCPLR